MFFYIQKNLYLFRHKDLSSKILLPILIIPIIVTLSLSSCSQSDTNKNLGEYLFQGLDAYQKQDYSGFLSNYQKALKLAPNNCEIMYNLARAYALKGHEEESIKLLNRVVDLGFYFTENSRFNSDEIKDFTLIKNTDEFKNILTKIREKNVPVNNSKIAFKIPEKDLMPESIAFDPVEKIFYLGSVYKCKIISIDREGVIKDFVSERQDGLWSVSGLKVDAKNRFLWANSSVIPGMKGFNGQNHGFTGVFKYNLENGSLIKKYLLISPIGHSFNDLVVTSHGDVFLTDSYFGAIYKIPHNKDELELFVKPNRFSYPNGIALSNDEKYLYVSHVEGVTVIRLDNKSYFALSNPEDITMTGIDGLYFYKNSLIAIQNHRPPRVIRFYLNKDFDQVRSGKIIEFNNPLIRSPTTGTLIDNSFYYAANSQLKCYTDDHKIFPLDKLNEIIIMKSIL